MFFSSSFLTFLIVLFAYTGQIINVTITDGSTTNDNNNNDEEKAYMTLNENAIWC